MLSCRLAHLILLHFLGLSVAAALALVVGEVAVLAVGHLVAVNRSSLLAEETLKQLGEV